MRRSRDREAAPSRAPHWFYAFIPVNIANGATSPLIPLYMVISLGASVLDVGFLFFFTSLAAVPGAILWGRLSDRIHRRRLFVLIGLASFAFTLPIMAITRDLWVYLLANALLGFFQAAGAATSTVLIMETHPQKEWPHEIGRFAEVSGVAFVGGLLLGAVWFLSVPLVLGPSFSLEMLFLFSAFLSGLSVVMGAITLREGHRRVSRAEAADSLAHLGHSIIEKRRMFALGFHHVAHLSWRGVVAAARKPIGAYCFGIFLLFTGFLVFNAPLPIFLLNEARLSKELIFWVYLANSGVAAALYARAGRRCAKDPPHRLLLLAAGSRIILYPVFAVSILLFGPGSFPSLFMLSTLNAMAGASWAFINVASSVVASQLAEPENKAEAMGLYNASIGAGAIVGSVLGGVLAQQFAYLEVFITASLCIAAGVIVVLLTSTWAPRVVEDKRPTRARRRLTWPGRG